MANGTNRTGKTRARTETEDSLPGICIVGDQGKMGRMFSERFRLAGYRVSGVDRSAPDGPASAPDEKGLAAALAASRLVLLCVPVNALVDALAFVAPRLDPGRHLLMDITSVKSLPMLWMDEAYGGETIGAHPLFGPNPALADMRVALVRGGKAKDQSCAQAEELFRRMGCAVFWTSAREHDAGVGIAQSLNFALSAAFFCALARRRDIKPFLTPSFKRHLESARKHLTQDTAMFCEFTAMNPEFPAALAEYQGVLKEAAGGKLAEIAAEARVWYEENSPAG
ncbi:MAG: prephenate dehydrogenase/arogenate dehydrogenase family protein [Desulfovibrio sp.]|jgi:prephenate dehydrogenase|nr:prephenate dehydrogenase/arogenate dehydrogenase family protein [Desulfovibrio sp.]